MCSLRGPPPRSMPRVSLIGDGPRSRKPRSERTRAPSHQRSAPESIAAEIRARTPNHRRTHASSGPVFRGAVTRRPGDKRRDRLAVEPERAADPQRQKLIPLAQPVNQGRADAETGCASVASFRRLTQRNYVSLAAMSPLPSFFSPFFRAPQPTRRRSQKQMSQARPGGSPIRRPRLQGTRRRSLRRRR